MKSGRGFVISFDALLALFVVFSFLVASFALLSRAEEKGFGELSLQVFSFDVLKVLERSGKLQDAVVFEDSSSLDSFLNFLPYYYCARLEVFEEGFQQPLIVAARTDCRNVPASFFLARSFFHANREGVLVFYTVELKAWQSG